MNYSELCNYGKPLDHGLVLHKTLRYQLGLHTEKRWSVSDPVTERSIVFGKTQRDCLLALRSFIDSREADSGLAFADLLQARREEVMAEQGFFPVEFCGEIRWVTVPE